MPSRLRRIVRVTLVLALVAATGGALGYGWQLAQNAQLTGVEFSGVEHADAELLHSLLALPDSARIFDLDPKILADRAERAPWVRRARVRRWLSGTLTVAIEERQPVALVIDDGGRAVAFLDAEGYSMPLTPSAKRLGHDLPLVSGRLPRLLPTQPITDAPLRRLLAALPPPGTFGDALISNIERRAGGDLVVVTAPGPGGAAITANLGRDDFAARLRQLEAFWEQVVLPRPEPGMSRIDLRFAGQIVTDEPTPTLPSRTNPNLP